MNDAPRKTSVIVLALTIPLLQTAMAIPQETNPPVANGRDVHLIEVSPENEPPPLKALPSTIEVVVINPFRSANVGPQVGGVIRKFNFDEGDYVEQGQVVCELDPTRYKIAVDRARERVNELEVAQKRTEEDAQIKEELLSLNLTTRVEAAKAQAEYEMALVRVTGAQKEFDMAQFDLDACRVKAPFSGFISAKQKLQDESVDRLQTIFSIVDSSKVYAVANVPVSMLSHFPIGAEAYFVYCVDKKVKGVVDRIAKVIDPKSKTKRIYLLIDNSAGDLEVGMTGALQLVKR